MNANQIEHSMNLSGNDLLTRLNLVLSLHIDTAGLLCWFTGYVLVLVRDIPSASAKSGNYGLRYQTSHAPLLTNHVSYYYLHNDIP